MTTAGTIDVQPSGWRFASHAGFLRVIALSFLLVTVAVASSCRTGPRDYAGSAKPTRACLLAVRYRSEHEKDVYWEAFAHTVANERHGFRLSFDNGRVWRGRPVLVRDVGSCRLERVEAAAETALWFSEEMLFSTEVFGDDRVRWTAVLGWHGELTSEFLANRSPPCLVLCFDGSSPPGASLFVDKLSGYEVRWRDGWILLRGLFVVERGVAAFPPGNGEVTVAIPIESVLGS